VLSFKENPSSAAFHTSHPERREAAKLFYLTKVIPNAAKRRRDPQ